MITRSYPGTKFILVFCSAILGYCPIFISLPCSRSGEGRKAKGWRDRKISPWEMSFIEGRKPSPVDFSYVSCAELGHMSTLRPIPGSFPGRGFIPTLPEIKGLPPPSWTNQGSTRRKRRVSIGGQQLLPAMDNFLWKFGKNNMGSVGFESNIFTLTAPRRDKSTDTCFTQKMLQTSA